ncbi:hypothetical protein CBR_g48206 [Chara braunii]|uniref:Exocyst complex component Sec3 PIP2-binding N-terminal domain-containing protein n=1 Tax=Chara braunii TaxID=69332 RepID=A0A388M282_CHABU|nr:hypothetical protein CBR_g48206 [Chara braunii]|eukprot:GBG88674.1 hypothetical protein CBR_g48206 [Chara braunii]
MMEEARGGKSIMQAVEAAFAETDSTVILGIKVSKSQAAWGGVVRKGRMTSKPRILAITAKRSATTQKFKIKMHALKPATGSGLPQMSKEYKLKHLVRVEAVEGDKSGLGFVLVFDNSKGIPAQWSCRSIEDRNGLFVTLRQLSKDHLGRVPSLVGFDLVELALWAQSNAKPLPIAGTLETARKLGEAGESVRLAENAVQVVGQHDLVSAQEEKDMEALLGTYVMGIDEAEAFSERLKRELSALEAANLHAILDNEPMVEEIIKGLENVATNVEDMDEWLHIFNIKLKHMREDIEMIERRNNMLDRQEQNTRGLLGELDKLLNKLHVPPEYASLLVESPFDEPLINTNCEAADWLVKALMQLSSFSKDPLYSQMRVVREKKAVLDNLKTMFARRAQDFLQEYFMKIVDFTPPRQQGSLPKGGPLRGGVDHSDLQWNLKSYARLIQYLKALDEASLQALRKSYASAMNHLLRREMRDTANELKNSVKVPASRATSWLESGAPNPNSSDSTSGVSDVFARMLHVFLPLFVSESMFFAAFMCFDASPAVPSSLRGGSNTTKDDDDDDDVSPMALDGSDAKPPAPTDKEVRELNSALDLLFAGMQDELIAVADWACKVDPLRCIAMLGVMDRCLISQSKEPGSFLFKMLKSLQERINQNFDRFVDEMSHSIERYDRNMKTTGVLPYFQRFEALAQRMECLVKNKSRDAVDRAYKKIVANMFEVLENIAKADPKHADVLLLENYAAFQNSTYEIAQHVPTLGEYYHRASSAYDAACQRYITAIIDHQFGKLFEFAKKIEENLLFQRTPEEISFQPNLTRADLRKLLKATLSASPGVEKLLQTMYKRMQKHISPEMLPLLWQKCKDDFLRQYESLENLISKCYPGEVLSPSCNEMRELFKTV